MNEKLKTFLYILMRDELTPGAVEKIMQNHVKKIGDSMKRTGKCPSYSNQFLAGYAEELTRRLLS